MEQLVIGGIRVQKLLLRNKYEGCVLGINTSDNMDTT